MRSVLAGQLTAALCVAGFSMAPTAAAAPPQCTDVAPNTTMCRTPGHTQITTSPDQAMTNPYPGWGFGGIGIGGGGIWIGPF